MTKISGRFLLILSISFVLNPFNVNGQSIIPTTVVQEISNPTLVSLMSHISPSSISVNQILSLLTSLQSNSTINNITTVIAATTPPSVSTSGITAPSSIAATNMHIPSSIVATNITIHLSNATVTNPSTIHHIGIVIMPLPINMTNHTGPLFPLETNMTNHTGPSFPPETNMTNHTGPLFPTGTNMTIHIGPLLPPETNMTNHTGLLFPTGTNMTNHTGPLFPTGPVMTNHTGPLFPPETNMTNHTRPLFPPETNFTRSSLSISTTVASHQQYSRTPYNLATKCEQYITLLILVHFLLLIFPIH